jgi:hypothetical protein
MDRSVGRSVGRSNSHGTSPSHPHLLSSSHLASSHFRLVQSSFYLCIYYHLCVFDPYVKPVVQGLIGAGLSDASYIEVVHVLGVLWLIVMALLQALVFGPAWNPFAPIHDALYNIAGVPRITKDAPAPTTKGKGKSKKN